MIENMSHVCTSAATLFFSAIIPFLGDPPLLVHELPVGLSEYTADCGQGGHEFRAVQALGCMEPIRIFHEIL